MYREDVAGNKANRYLTTGDAVSAYHVDCIIRRNVIDA